VGDKRVGVAISDPYWIVVTPYRTFENDDRIFEKIANLIEEFGIKKVIVGLPLTLSGEEGTQAKKTREFAKNLQNFINVPIEFVDERFTTDMAQELLKTKKRKYQKDKEKKDSIAAAFILESFINQTR